MILKRGFSGLQDIARDISKNSTTRNSTKNNTKGSLVSFGNFDAIHQGHQEIIKSLVKAAKDKNLPSILISFEPLAFEFFASARGENPANYRLTNLEEKVQILKQLGVDYLLLFNFNEEFSQLTSTYFIAEILVKQLAVTQVFAGVDLRFGFKAEGDLKQLQSFATSHNFKLNIIKSAYLNDLGQDIKISSSLVRKRLLEHDLDAAKIMLKRDYGFCGRIVKGREAGSSLGFPTINLFIKNKHKLYLLGVFVVKLSFDDSSEFFGVANVGYAPSFGADNKLTLEVHLFNFNKQVYGVKVRVSLLHFLRHEKKFKSLDDLKQQINSDIKTASCFVDTLQQNL